MQTSRIRRSAAGLAGAILCLAGAGALAKPVKPAHHPPPMQTYSDNEVVEQASHFFSTGAKDLSQVIKKVLKEKGDPVAIIRGEEAGGAIAFGLRYGHGELVVKGAPVREIYWQGPSIGFDIGANAVKTFILVYGLPNAAALYQRFPGVDGSLYFIGGFGVNYLQRGSITLAPVRFGVGWRQGIALNYLNFSPTKRLNPF
ncbi:MAG TPA: EipA family protein [Steroidobacteraceae bacterium]|nr:EipA family protein [Steroidobacteraceae bacterium]